MFTRKIPFIIALFCALSGLAMYVNYLAPPDGYTGAPDEPTCGSCHTEPNEPYLTTVTIAGLPPEVIMGEVYPLTLEMETTYGVFAGMEMVSLRSDLTNAGTWSNLGPGLTSSTSNNRRYLKHDESAFMPFLGNNVPRVHTWTVSWRPGAVTVPEAATLYLAGVAGGETAGEAEDALVQSTVSTTVYRLLSAEQVSLTRITCAGENTGSITVTGVGGKTPYAYSWSNGATQATAANLGAGDYAVTVTDQLGQTASLNFALGDPSPLTGDISTAAPVSCSDSADGALLVVAEGGVPPYTYAWSSGATTADATGLPAGSYTVSITDGLGCTEVQQATLSAPPAINLNLDVVTAVACAGEASGGAGVSASGGVGLLGYSWSNGATGPTLGDVPAGNYALTVTDANDCTANLSVEITEPLPLLVNLVDEQAPGCGDNAIGRLEVSASGGTSPYTYAWSNGGTGPVIDGLTGGVYTVTVTDGEGCAESMSYPLSAAEAPDLAAVGTTDPSCADSVDGMIEVDVTGGTPPYTYAWSNGGASADQSNLPEGEFSLTVTDALGCAFSATFTLEAPALLQIEQLTSLSISCAGGADGLLSATASGGTPPYSFAWSNGAMGPNVAGLSAGTYELTVTDGNACTFSTEATLTDPAPLNISATEINDVACAGEMSGFIAVQVDGGLPPYTYQWSNGGDDDLISDVPAGSYTLTVTDGNGCQTTTSWTIGEPDPLAVMALGLADVSCPGGTDGVLQVMGTGGRPPYSYVWSNGGTTGTIDGLAANAYSLTLTDDNGCMTTEEFTLVEPPSWNGALNVFAQIACFGEATGGAEVLTEGGTPPYTYLWSNGELENVAFALPAGEVFVTVTDAQGCNYVESAAIAEPPLLEVLLTEQQNAGCQGEPTGMLAVMGQGGTPPYVVLWEDGSDGLIRDNLPAGAYTATVSDANGCTAERAFTIQQAGTLVLSVDATDISCAESADGAIALSVTGGEAPYHYQWSNGQTGAELTNLAAGNYTVTITDEGGCTIIEAIGLGAPAELTIANVSVAPASDEAGGSIAVEVTGGTGGYTYDWAGPDGFSAGAATITDLAPGDYAFTVTDENGCVITSDGAITVDFMTATAAASLRVGRLYPNPTRGGFWLEGFPADTRLEVFDARGRWLRLMRLDNTGRQPVATTTWPPGLYFLRLSTDQGGERILRLVVLGNE